MRYRASGSSTEPPVQTVDSSQTAAAAPPRRDDVDMPAAASSSSSSWETENEGWRRLVAAVIRTLNWNDTRRDPIIVILVVSLLFL